MKKNDETEKDFIIVGDMNIYNRDELMAVLPEGYRSLNESWHPTNVSPNGKPYDHVMYHVDHTGEYIINQLEIVDLMETMRPYWQGPGPYPESDLNLYFQVFSDHRPIVFTMVSDGVDDD